MTDTKQSKKRVLMVVANPTKSATTGWPVGFWGCELTHQYFEYTEAGYEVDIASPKGGKAELDGWSDPRNKEGYETRDLITMGFLNVPECAALIDDSKKLADCNPAQYDAICLVGGQAPPYMFREDATVQKAVRSFWESGKLVVALCHGVCGLLDVTLTNGDHLIKGKTITGFSNVEEDYVDAMIKTKFQPYRVEDEARKRGANFVSEGLWRSYAVRDGRLITGQQSYSARETARAVIQTLGTTVEQRS